jgi:hypothetical protein
LKCSKVSIGVLEINMDFGKGFNRLLEIQKGISARVSIAA